MLYYLSVVLDDVPLGIEDPEPHDIVTLADLNYTQRTVFIINDDENGNINEDATSYSNDDLNIIVPVIQNGK